MKLRLALLACTAITASALIAPAHASDKAEIERLERRVQQLEALVNRMAAGGTAAPAGGNAAIEQRVQDLEIAQSARLNKLEEKAATDAVLTFRDARPTFSTPDGKFTMAFRGRFHFDAGHYSQDPGVDVPFSVGGDNVRDLNSGSFFRRSHFGVEGKVFEKFDYEFRYNFGGSESEGSGNIHTMRVAYNPTKEIRINVGAMQPTFTLDNSTSSNDIMFLERSSVTNATIGEFGGSDSRKGIELTYLKGDFMVNAAYTTSQIGTRFGTADDRDHLLGRVAYRAYKTSDIDVHIGANAATIVSMGGVDTTGGLPSARNVRFRERPELRVDQMRLVDTGNIAAEGGTMYGLEAGFRYKGLTVQGEYIAWEIDRDRECATCSLTAPNPDFDGYYVQASYILTGETRRYNTQSSGNSRMNFGAPKPKQPFNGQGGWGAFEIAARYSVLDLNYNVSREGLAPVSGEIRGGEQTIASVALNWYLNNNVRLMFQYQNVDIDRISAVPLNNVTNPGTPTSAYPNIGQNYDSFAVRTQFAF